MAKSPKRAAAAKKRNIHTVMGEFSEGKLHSGSGKKVRSRKQAVAIAMAESRRKKKR